MFKKTSVKQQGKMATSDILHAHAFIFYFEKCKKIQCFDTETFLPQSAPAKEFQFSGSFLTKGFFFLC